MPGQSNLGKMANQMTNLPGEVLGVIPSDDPVLNAKPPTTSWVGPSGAVDLTEPPPPWEQGLDAFSVSDARRFVGVPENWELRWINPRLLESEGWRDWQPVMASDPRVTPKVPTMVAPDGNIKRGGDILAWMYKSWVEARERQWQRDTDRLTASAKDRQDQLKDDFQRGKYGPYLNMDDRDVRHPTHTIADGRSMKD